MSRFEGQGESLLSFKVDSFGLTNFTMMQTLPSQSGSFPDHTAAYLKFTCSAAQRQEWKSLVQKCQTLPRRHGKTTTTDKQDWR